MIELLKEFYAGKAKPASGGGGSSDYSDLENKPQINDVTLSGNKTSSDLGLQDTLVSGTNIKTINNASILGGGNLSVECLPDQTGNAGKSLYTDGEDASWKVTRDPNTYRSLSSAQATTLLSDGTYNGELVTNGEIFTSADGTFKQYSDTVLPPAVQWAEASKNFIAFANNGTTESFTETKDGKIWKTTDGVSFEQITTSPTNKTPTESWMQFFDNKLWLAERVVDGNMKYSYICRYDVEGGSWETLWSYEVFMGSELNGFAVGMLEDVLTLAIRLGNTLQFSTDLGVTWETSSSAPPNYEPVKYLGGKFVTSDGFTGWKYATSKTSWYAGGYTGGGNIKDFIYDGEKYIAICADSSLTTTTDFTAFTNLTNVGLPAADDGNNNRIGFSNGVYVALIANNKIYTATDISDWDESSTSMLFSGSDTTSPIGFNEHFFFHANNENKSYVGVYTAAHERALTPLSYNKTQVDALISGGGASYDADTGTIEL